MLLRMRSEVDSYTLRMRSEMHSHGVVALAKGRSRGGSSQSYDTTTVEDGTCTCRRWTKAMLEE
jgi:hypothetical protein